MRTIIKATLVECDECGIEKLVQSVVEDEIEVTLAKTWWTLVKDVPRNRDLCDLCSDIPF